MFGLSCLNDARRNLTTAATLIGVIFCAVLILPKISRSPVRFSNDLTADEILVQTKPQQGYGIAYTHQINGTTSQQSVHTYTSTNHDKDVPRAVSTFVHYKNKADTYQSVCHNVTVNDSECEWHTHHEKKESLRFPLHYVSGVPGSGNDWILWLAAPSRYTWSRISRQMDCSLYKLLQHRRTISDRQMMNCLFLKTHEPWFRSKEISLKADKTVLLLRHPYDAAFAEFKRKQMEKHGSGSSLKQSNKYVKTSQFFNIKTRQSAAGWLRYLLIHIQKFVNHAKFWLTEYKRPVHVLLYKSVQQNTAYEVEMMQRFLGYEFNSVNFRRHCCAVSNTYNPSLKRAPSEVDKYRNLTLETEPDVREKIAVALQEVHSMLDEKFPEEHYRIVRG